MKKILTFAWLVAAILFSRSVTGQQVTKAEYFFDSDPGIGKGTAITVNSPGDSIDVNTSVSTTGLVTGFHALFVRVKESNGKWSLYQGQNFYIYPNVSNTASPRIKYAEYFIDNDPGVGKGNSVAVTAADSIDVNSSVSTTGLSQGFHALFVRVKDSIGRWSLYAGQNFYLFTLPSNKEPRIKAAEYFIDNDPGIGQGTAVTVTANDSIDVNSTVNLTGLSQGFHALFVRVKDSLGRWSLYQGQNFYVEGNVASAGYKIIKAEAFFDTDPGLGKATAIAAFTAADSVDLFRSITATGLPIGGHNLYVRVQNDSLQWSMALKDSFTIANRCTGVTITGSPNKVCAGDTATITATGGKAYTWNNGDTTSAIKVVPPITDTFYVQVSNTACISDTSFAIAVSPSPSVTVSGNDTTCSGSSTTLTATGGGTYLWSTSATTSQVTVSPTKTTTYSVAVTNGGCSKDTTVKVTVNPLPSVSITASKDTLTASGGTGYVWNTGGTNDTIVVHVTGRYSVTATDAEGCSDTSSYYIVVTSIADLNAKSDNVTIFPNPNNGEFTLQYNLSSDAQLRIVDITGKTIYSENISANGTKQFEVPGLNSGLYFWQMVSGNALTTEGKITVIK